MELSEIQFYVRQLRYFYQEVFLFIALGIFMVLPLGLSPQGKLIIAMLAWASCLVIRGFSFDIPSNMIRCVCSFSKKWEEKKIDVMKEKKKELTEKK